MVSPEARLFCRLDQMPGSDYDQQRLHTLLELGLLEPESIPIFDEATQTAAHVLDAPICILGLLDRDRLRIKSAVGLSRIGLMNELAASRQLPRQESFCTHVVDSQQVLMVPDATAEPAFANSVLVQRYGIRSYLGAPLMASNQQCLGTLAILSLVPRSFTSKEAEILQLIARWSISEFERNRILTQNQAVVQSLPVSPSLPASLSTSLSAQSLTSSGLDPSTGNPIAAETPSLASVKVRLLSQMTQELCTPLTSVMGMAKVLSQGIYGSLTEKQKEYIEIIHHSGQYLSALINEVMELGTLDDGSGLSLIPIDIEMLCQQAIATLNQAAQRHNQQIQLTVEPGPRIWLLDKDKVRQMLYHLVFSIIQTSSPESIIRLHVSRRQSHLNMTIWTSHPWLGEGLPHVEVTATQILSQFKTANVTTAHRTSWSDRDVRSGWEDGELSIRAAMEAKPSHTVADSDAIANSRQSLGITLSRQLAKLHGGSIAVQGSSAEGYRYVIKLPHLTEQPSQE
jgi:signal transduction histidine kinase